MSGRPWDLIRDKINYFFIFYFFCSENYRTADLRSSVKSKRTVARKNGNKTSRTILGHADRFGSVARRQKTMSSYCACVPANGRSRVDARFSSDPVVLFADVTRGTAERKPLWHTTAAPTRNGIPVCVQRLPYCYCYAFGYRTTEKLAIGRRENRTNITITAAGYRRGPAGSALWRRAILSGRNGLRFGAPAAPGCTVIFLSRHRRPISRRSITMICIRTKVRIYRNLLA